MSTLNLYVICEDHGAFEVDRGYDSFVVIAATSEDDAWNVLDRPHWKEISTLRHLGITEHSRGVLFSGPEGGFDEGHWDTTPDGARDLRDVEVTSCKDCPFLAERWSSAHSDAERVLFCRSTGDHLDYTVVLAGGIPVLCPLSPIGESRVITVRLAPKKTP